MFISFPQIPEDNTILAHLKKNKQCFHHDGAGHQLNLRVVVNSYQNNQRNS